MSLSDTTVQRLATALTSRDAANEIAAAITLALSGAGGGSGFSAWAEIPGGLQNASNKTFTLEGIPSSDDKLLIVWNGQVLTVKGGDLTRVGNSITMINVAPDSSGSTPDIFLAYYS
jgi:hypothetical protein